MIQKRELATCIILTIVTCGIYGIYWFFCIHNDTVTASGEQDTSAGMAFLLSIVTCGIYSFYWLYKRGQLIDKAYQNRGQQSSDKGVLYLILGVVGLSIIAYVLMQMELNKIADLDNGAAA